QYQAISHDGTAATMNVSGGCYWAAAGALLSTAGVFAAIPTGGASLWIAYGGTVVSHGGAIQSCAGGIDNVYDNEKTSEYALRLALDWFSTVHYLHGQEPAH